MEAEKQEELKRLMTAKDALRLVRDAERAQRSQNVMRYLATGKYGGNGNNPGKRYENKTGAGERARRARALARREAKCGTSSQPTNSQA